MRGERFQAGQAAVEYLVIITGVLIAMIALEIGGRLHCMKGFSGRLASENCQNMVAVFSEVMRETVEEITFLVNMPF